MTDPTPVFDAAFWNDLYAEPRWSGNPNAHLVTEATVLAPGTAVDVGSGEGGDTFWLAERGWEVTGVDLSEVALERAREAAAVRGLAITFELRDLLEWTPPAAAFDLVSMQYGHFPTPVMHDVVERLAAAVAPGGTLLIVGHARSEHNHQFSDDFFYTGPELAGLLSTDWTVVFAGDRVHPAREGLDVVLNARRPA